MKGKINILKQHVVGISGELSVYVLVTDEDICTCIENLEGIKKKNFGKQKADYEFHEEVPITVNRESADSELTGKHRPCISGH